MRQARLGLGVLFLASACLLLPARDQRALLLRGTFGAAGWPFGLALLCVLPGQTLAPDAAQFFYTLHWPGVAVYIVFATQLLVLAKLCTALHYMTNLLGTDLTGQKAVYLDSAFWMFREYVWWFVVVRLTAIAIAYLRAALRGMPRGAALPFPA